MAIQIGKYKRPGIFIEEFDNSIISSPAVEGITNMIIGVSKKGPINTPIRITNLGDFEAIFGQLDRNLERKGSFFHRTVSKMLEVAPVFAMNLLLTDDNLDLIEYKSISSATQFNNDVLREGPYRRFYDTTGFWRRDTFSFMNLTKNNAGYSERAFNLTNVGDRPISVFIFKSSMTGFNRTLLEWYGSIDKMPSYVNPQDFASDYMVDVVVVAGDWTNYQELSVDTRWSNYFNASGLRKEQIRNFASDRNVNLLAYYEGLSLIPYFRDSNGRNLFIETTINRDTDRTGLFCAFNNDLVEDNYYNGLLDIIGNTIVGKMEADIEFLSYKETIAEQIEITSTPLDLPGNVTGMLGSIYYGYQNQDPHAFSGPKPGTLSIKGVGPATTGLYQGAPASNSGIVNNTAGLTFFGNTRTAYYAEGAVYNVNEKASPLQPVSTTSSITVTYQIAPGAFAVINDTFVELSSVDATTTEDVALSVNASDYPITSGGATYAATFVIDSNGELKTITSTVEFDPNLGNYPTVLASDIVLGYMTFQVGSNGQFSGIPQMNRLSIDSNGYKDIQFGTASGEYFIEEINGLGTGDAIRIEFYGTDKTPKINDYKGYRLFKMFNRLLNLLNSPDKEKRSLNLGPNLNFRKVSFDQITVSDITTSSLQNKSFVLNTGLTSTELADILDGHMVIYTLDNEFIMGSKGISSKESAASLTNGVVGKYSKFYTRYYDGIINNRDYFHSNRIYQDYDGESNDLLGYTVDVTFLDGESVVGLTGPNAGYDYIIFETDAPISATAASVGSGLIKGLNLQTFEQLVFPGATKNRGAFTIVANSVNPLQTPNQLANVLGYPNGFAYQVNEEVEFEYITDQKYVFDYLKKHYIKMYLENNGNLQVEFLDELLESAEEVNTQANSIFFVQSEKSNLKQTVEIETPTSYIQTPNKILIDGQRYTEVKVGDFLEAYVDETTLEEGQYPRRLTRILSKRAWSGDPSLTEVTCDARINKWSYGDGDYQTMRYVSIENYVSTYKAISLKGFKIRQASLPDGTEARQNSILNLVAKGTPLFKALTNKEGIDFRYLIDSFGLGLTDRSKQQLVDICGERLDAFGFINMPSLRQFKNSTSPSFVNREGVLQLEYVAQGGDPESNPAFLYSFGDGAGSTCVGYFTPYVIINDNGRPLEHPPAPFVATTFMRKHISNVTNVTPWTIAAGITNGRIVGINSLEMTFTPTDIEYLNQAQMNPLAFKRNRGFVIETENTAQTVVKSALSYIHVREVLIELEREIAAMLLDYQWKFNTADVRAEIKLRADSICETYVSRNGLYNYFNKMDEENNTPDIIDNQIGVIDTYVEPIKGMGIIVNNITILRTGAISAGGFINP
jgi:hypothetical protein